MARILFVNRFYAPDTTATAQLLTDLAQAAVTVGHEVIVITSGERCPLTPKRERLHGVDVRRIKRPHGRGNSVTRKVREFAMFYLGALWHLCREVHRGNTVVVLTDPPLLGIAAIAVAKVKGARLLHWVQDIYPDVAIAVTGHRWLAVFKPLRNAAWRSADGCVTLGGDMADVIAAAGVPRNRIDILPNWPPVGLGSIRAEDGAIASVRGEWQATGKFVVTYSGNLGRVHSLCPILAAARLLRDRDNIVFVFVGGGAQRASLEAEARRSSLRNIRFAPSQPRDRLAAVLSAGNVHLVTLRAGCERYVFPSKIYGIVAVGRPIVFVGPPACEVARMVCDRRLGWVVDPAEPSALAALIAHLAADSAEVERHAESAAEFGLEAAASNALAGWLTLLRTSACAADSVGIQNPRR